MRQIFFFLFSCTAILLFSGCVSIPVDPVSKEISVGELSAHVEFLAQPALKGRRPRTLESAAVRKYLSKCLSAYGFKPWANCKKFAQPFGLGTNVIGVLPGSDPVLAGEIVILSAHYDHLGPVNGDMCLGAGDNASAVAAVLEIAESLSKSEERPKRTICLAFFDAEETGLVGSFAFTLREDFQNSNVTAAVNIDMLGRELFDVVDDSLCMVGSEKFPKLRQHILSSGLNRGLTLLPLGMDLVGPRGDFLPFDNIVRQNLFFTCGVFADYHRGGDLPEKLDYFKIKNSALTILETVRYLADTEEYEKPEPLENSYHDELLALSFILEKINLRYEQAGITALENQKLQEVAAEAQTLLKDKDLSKNARRKFAVKSIEALLPALAVTEQSLGTNSSYIRLYEMCIPYKDRLIEAYRQTIAEILDNKLGMLFGKKEFCIKEHVLADDDISLVQNADGLYELDVVLTKLDLAFYMDGFIVRRGNFGIGFDTTLLTCRGTKEEIADYCLLWWGEGRIQDKDLYEPSLKNILERVAEYDTSQGYQACLKQRLDEGGFESRKEWAAAMLESENYDFLRMAVVYASKWGGDEVFTKLAEIIQDENVQEEIRAQAIKAVSNDSPKKVLLAVANVIDDQTPYSIEKHCPCFKEGYALEDHPALRGMKKQLDKAVKENGDSTIGQEALKKLHEITNENLGTNKSAWNIVIASR